METEELVPGHCRIVPLSHCLSCLEVDEEEGWEEIKVSLVESEPRGAVPLTGSQSFVTELHEDLDTNVRRGGQGSYLLRNNYESQVSETQLYRSDSSSFRSLRSTTNLLPGKSPGLAQ